MSGAERKVLFVDDSPEFLDATRHIMAQIAGPSWTIYTAQNAGQAMNIIAEKQIDLVVLDVLMPIIDGMQFLSLLNRKHPNVLKAVLTGDASDMHRTICMSRGAELFLAKPHSQGEWRLIFESLNGIGKLQPQEGFRGVLRRVGLQDVLQMECLSRNSALLEITTKELRGHIYIQEGQIIHADAGDRSGTEAFNFLMGLTGGEFSQKPFVTPPERTITDSWEFLLMEAARKHDELLGPEGEEDFDQELHGFEPPEFGPARNGTATAAPRWGDTPLSQLGSVRLPSQPPKPQPPPTPHKWQPPAAPPEPQTQFFARLPTPNPVDAQRPEVAEFVVFSSQGDLIYEWRCHDVNARVNFLEFLSQKVRLLCQGLPMGQFERFEVFGSKSRIITQLDNDHAVFVRTNVAPDASIPGDNS